MKKNPDIYLFNPTCDMAVGNGNVSWQANRLLRKMEADLATLPLFFAEKEDFVLVDEIPSHDFLDTLGELHLELPRFIAVRKALADEVFLNLPKNSLKPWGWSPAAHRLLAPLKQNCSEAFKNSPVFNWQPEYREFYSRQFANEILRRLISEFPREVFIDEDLLPRKCTQRYEFEKLLAQWAKLMLKAPWSSSGRGLQTITKTPVHEKVWEKVLGIVADQGYAMAEPFLLKKLDIAFQFKLKNGKVQFLGISNFMADKKGRYQGNHLNGLPDNTPAEILLFAKNLPELVTGPLAQLIEESELARHYEGIFGVDALVFEDETGKLKVNPCLEINLRHNMGLLALKLEKLVAADKKGVFSTWYGGGKSFLDFKREMETAHPRKIVDRKLLTGFLPLSDARPDSEFGAYILVPQSSSPHQNAE